MERVTANVATLEQSPETHVTVNLDDYAFPKRSELATLEASSEIQQALTNPLSPIDARIIHDLLEPALIEPKLNYMEEIIQTPLLSAQDEQDLCQIRERGLFAKNTLTSEDFMDSEKELLEQAVQDGTNAERRLVEANLKLVINVAKRFQDRGLEFLDLVQEGNIGLWTSIKKFDWRLGWRVSTYSYWWIRHDIVKAIQDTSRIIRLPMNIAEVMSSYSRKIPAMEARLGREPTDSEIADELTTPKTKVTTERVFVVKELLAREFISTSIKVGENRDTEIGDFIANDPEDTVFNPTKSAEYRALCEALLALQIASGCNQRQKAAIRLKFEADMVLGDIGDELGGVTGERARQLIAEAIRRMRSQLDKNPQLKESLKAFL